MMTSADIDLFTVCTEFHAIACRLYWRCCLSTGRVSGL